MPWSTPTAAALLVLSVAASAQTAPVAQDDAYTTTQGDNLSVDDPGVLENDEDADGDTLTAVLVDDAGTVGNLFLYSDGSLEYETNGFVGVETFSYVANDGTSNSNVATITFTVTGGTSLTTYTNETLFVAALADLGYTPHFEGFEDDGVWGAVRTPSTAPSVTSQGLTWESPIGSSGVTTGSGPVHNGGYGFFALPHGDYGAGPQCNTPGVCTDRWRISSDTPLTAFGGWVRSLGNGGKVSVILDGDEANPIEPHPGHIYTWVYIGVVVPDGFSTIEFREVEGVALDAFYIFGDSFTFARQTDSAWTDQGAALAGVTGDPLLVGSGPLIDGSNNAADLSNAAPSAIAGLFLGLSSTPIPFKGGTLKPFPFFDPVILNTSVSGTISSSFVMPAGVPTGTELWVQWAIQDAAAIKGVALSNAILGLTP
ncbi:MAG: hypothetical protein DRQ55_13735 [Planctomycetota bacterium]|nr:MAG: hypothetical protein DRQ55_13735 [Planctomycetota bacterium]